MSNWTEEDMLIAREIFQNEIIKWDRYKRSDLYRELHEQQNTQNDKIMCEDIRRIVREEILKLVQPDSLLRPEELSATPEELDYNAVYHPTD